MSDLTKLITESIDEYRSYVSYLDETLIVDIRDSFINATHMCKKDGKRFDKWLENAGSQELIKFVNEEITSPQNRREVSKSTRVVTGGQIMEIRGTYVHPLLLHAICMWVSPLKHLQMLPLITELTKNISFDFSEYNPQRRLPTIRLKQREDEWRQVMIEWSNISNSIISFQHQLDKYKIDAIVNSDIAVEFDENDHSGYNHVNDIVRTKKILSEYNVLVRLSDSRRYDVNMIDFVIKYVRSMQKNTIVHVNYRPEKVIRIDLIDNSITLYEITTNEVYPS